MVGTGQLAEALIDRFHKNRDRVYLLTGRRECTPVRQRVFEQYDFAYDDDSVKDIFDSIKPDITIFTGAWDSQFDWEKARQESVRYTAGLINLLTVYSMRGKGRFVYLSSQEVFTGSFHQNVLESQDKEPKGFRSMAIAQGEDICANFRQNQGLEIDVLRLDHLYCVPKKGQPTPDPCCAMCLEALKSGKILASSRDVFSMLFVKDAAELACKAITAPKLEQSVYHISSMEEIDGLQLAKLIQETMSVEVADESVGEYRRLILDGSAFSQEMGQKIFTHYPEGVKRVAQYMKRNRESFIQAEDAGGSRAARMLHGGRILFAALVPYMENIVCFILFFLLNRLAAGGSFFRQVDLFLLYVLLFAVTMGQRQAVLSSFLASIGYFLLQSRGYSGFAVLMDYSTYVWMGQLFIVGMVVGYIKDQIFTLKEDSREKIAYLEGRLRDIEEINDSNVRMKENFETQLINQKDSLGKIYDITSTLEHQAPEEVLFTAVQVLSQLMDCGGAAIYTVANRNYARLFSSTSKEARNLGHSIEYTAMTEMYDELKERRVFINKSMRKNLPLMASAVYSGDDMELIFMLWGIPWQRMTMSEANRLAVIGQMVKTAVVRANQYLDVLSSQRYVEGSRLMAGDAFLQLARAFLGARDQGLTECALLKVPVPDKNCVAAASALSGSTRQSDYMGSVRDGVLYVLLSNTSSENAGIIQERFLAAGYESCLVEEAAL